MSPVSGSTLMTVRAELRTEFAAEWTGNPLGELKDTESISGDGNATEC